MAKLAPSMCDFSAQCTNAITIGEVGNGRACAILLARQGAKVALVDFNEQWAQDTKDMISKEGGVSEVVQTDVTNEESVKRAVEKTVRLFGRVDVLINIGMSQRCYYRD